MDLPPGLTTRPLVPADAEAVRDLIAASELHDLGQVKIDLEDIVGDWQRPSFTIAEHSIGVEADGALVAYAEVYAGRFADAHVPPPPVVAASAPSSRSGRRTRPDDRAAHSWGCPSPRTATATGC